MTAPPHVAGLDAALVARAAALHGGEARGYHGWSHPLALLRLHEEVRDRLDDPLAVACAILFHDAIYEPRATDNERRSAALAEELLDDAVPEATRARCG